MRKLLLTFALLAAGSALFRVPAFLNARDVNADSAVIGLQAMHLLRGEWSWFCWGAGYQSSLDSTITAAAFAIFGPSPLVLMLVPFFGFLVALLLALAVLRKRMSLPVAALCTLPLVIAPWAINSVILFPPRQWSVTIAFASIWLLDGSAQSRWPAVRLSLGTLCAFLAMAADMLAALFLPGLMLLAFLCAFDGRPDLGTSARRLAGCAVGLLVGAAVIGLILLQPQASTKQAKLSPERLVSNARLLWDQCLPFALGYALYSDSEFPYQRTLRTAPMPWQALQFAGGWSLVAGIVAGGILGASKLCWPLRRLGIFGFAVSATTLAGFMLSVMPADMWAVRYLGPVFWTAPFALSPLAAMLGAKRFALAITPYLIVAAVGGWLSYGFWVEGFWPRTSPAAIGKQERELVEFLRARGIRYAATDYWLAYRLTYLYRENPIIVPIDMELDRYKPYLDGYAAEPIKALIFHPAWTRGLPAERFMEDLQAMNMPFVVHKVDDFTVVIYRDNVPTVSPG